MSGPLLVAEGLTKRYGGLVAVSDLSFKIEPGEILGLIGPNGAGKSTTFNLISGFVKPTRGTLTLFGKPAAGRSAVAASRAGLVRTFQHTSLMRTMTVAANLRVGTMHRLRRGAERDVAVDETAELLGLTPHLSDVAGTLPHGLQRLVSIGIAFAARPKLLCLDEPLTGLNATEVASTLAVFRRIRDEHAASILLVEHNMKAVMSVCDRIVVLHHGEELAEGTPEVIRADPEVISAYIGHRQGRQTP